MNAVITNPINLFLLVIGSYLGIKLAFFLFTKQSTKDNANLFLGISVLSQVVSLLTGMWYRFDLLAYVPHIIGLQHFHHFLVGPLAYFYVRACTQKEFQLRPLLLVHFLPFLFDIVYHLPLLLQTGSEKLAYYNEFIQFGTLYSPKILNVLKTIHALIYFVLSVRLIQQYRKHLTNTASFIDKAFHRWLLFFIFIHVLPLLMLIGYAFTIYSREYTLLIFLSGVIAYLFALDMAVFLKPELFHTFPHQMLIPESSEEQKQKYEKSKLEESKKGKYIEQLQDFMVTNKPYLAPELTLAQLSEQVNIPSHYLSQIINEKLHCNFIDFINGYRVEEAIAKLTAPQFSHYTILAAAYEAGFNAKSTFYSVFKKQTGMTPSAYRKHAKMKK